jgi:hypothetical protein
VVFLIERELKKRTNTARLLPWPTSRGQRYQNILKVLRGRRRGARRLHSPGSYLESLCHSCCFNSIRVIDDGAGRLPSRRLPAMGKLLSSKKRKESERRREGGCSSTECVRLASFQQASYCLFVTLLPSNSGGDGGGRSRSSSGSCIISGYYRYCRCCLSSGSSTVAWESSVDIGADEHFPP